jgi:hypothetical protein
MAKRTAANVQQLPAARLGYSGGAVPELAIRLSDFRTSEPAAPEFPVCRPIGKPADHQRTLKPQGI